MSDLDTQIELQVLFQLWYTRGWIIASSMNSTFISLILKNSVVSQQYNKQSSLTTVNPTFAWCFARVGLPICASKTTQFTLIDHTLQIQGNKSRPTILQRTDIQAIFKQYSSNKSRPTAASGIAGARRVLDGLPLSWGARPRGSRSRSRVAPRRGRGRGREKGAEARAVAGSNRRQCSGRSMEWDTTQRPGEVPDGPDGTTYLLLLDSSSFATEYSKDTSATWF